MRMWQQTRFKGSIAALVCAVVCLTSNLAQATQNSIAVFQFTAQSMSDVGIENEVAYAIRNELGKRPSLLLLNQREMEVELARNDVAQTFDTTQALNASEILAVNFVLIGSVGRLNGKIAATIELVSSASDSVVQRWDLVFNNQQAVSNRSEEIGNKIVAAIKEHQQRLAQLSVSSSSFSWAENIQARNNEGRITLKWELLPQAPEALGYNIYRSNEASGPYSYVSSVVEPYYNEVIDDLSGNVYYQVSLINENGEELRSELTATTRIQAVEESAISSPVVLDFVALLRGVELQLLPSAQNAQFNIEGYQLLRRTADSSWVVVDSVQRAVEGNNKKQGIDKFSLRDALQGAADGEYSYAVRAVSGQEKGQLSEEFAYQTVTAPTLNSTDNAALRQIDLSWQAVSFGDGYKILRRPQGQTNWQEIATLSNIATNRYRDTNISADGQSFDYAIVVFDRYGATSPSEPLSLSSRPPLAAPQGLQVSDGLARRVELSWQPYMDEAVIGFAIYRAKFADGQRVMLDRVAEILDPEVTSYVDQSNLQDGERYQYAVAAINSFNTAGALTPAKSASTKPVPDPVTSFTPEPLGDSIRLSWTHANVQQVEKFKLERRWLNGQWQEIATLPALQVDYEDTDLMAQGKVNYRISAIDNDGLQSLEVESGTQTSPKQLALSIAAQGLLRQVNLSWEATPHVSESRLLRQYEGQDWQTIATLKPDQMEYADKTGLVDDAEYQYKLQTWYQDKLIAESTPVNASTKAIPTPGALQAEGGLASKIPLNWTAIPDNSVKQYVLFRWQADQSPATAIIVAEIPKDAALQYTDSVETSTPIVHGMQYNYALAIRNVFDAIGPMGEVKTVASKVVPIAPRNVVSIAQSASVVLSWSVPAEDDISQVEILRRFSHQSGWQQLTQVAGDQTKYTDEQLLPATETLYKLRFVDQDGLKSIYSAPVSQLSPTTVELSASSEPMLRKTQIDWTEHPLVEQYTVMRSTGAQGWVDVGKVSGTSFTDSKGLDDETVYRYQVIPEHQGSRLPASNTVEVATKALPEPPLNIVASTDQVQQVTLTWQAPEDSNISGYVVYRQLDDGELDKLSTLDANEGSFQDRGGFFSKLEHGSDYTYRVSALNPFKVEGRRSDLIEGKTKALPARSQGLLAEVSGASVNLIWNPNSEQDIRFYQIYRSKDCSRERELVKVSGQTTQYTDSDIESGKQYCYQVSAIDNDELEGQLSVSATVAIPSTGE